jgi:hypothetical protein
MAKTATVNCPGVGVASVAEYTLPTTWDEVQNWWDGSITRENPVTAVLVWGLIPMSPTTWDAGTEEIPVSASIA